ncbi:MAG: FAD-dependent oxidoreductase [Pseudomonadota bacterium]
MRNPQHDILFEPVRIGPVTAKNRFYQVPHCTGMGWRNPRMLAHMRGTKAEGGWGVVCTEWCSIHPSSDDLPYPNASIWDDGDITAHRLMTDAVHEHGALAGVELWHGGSRAQNLFSREVGMDVGSMPNAAGFPFQTRSMTRADIRELRVRHRAAALRAKEADFDIVYVYATHGYLLSHFLSPDTNTRTDEYGGALENRTRLLRELIEETKDAVGDRCAVAVRFSADLGGGNDGELVVGEQRDMLAMLADLPDLWDINIADYSLEMGVSRFVKEGSLEPYIQYVKTITDKPVVSVGRFTSPDTMASQVRRGVLDFVGAARPSIADPFLPNKIEHGRPDEIRECIGCNICYSGDGTGTPLHCTQNPTFAEGWRRGWHPENASPKKSDSTILVIGSGPAGLEATRVLAKRGYRVILAEARTELGGRVARESRLPGLGEWIRVRDYRVQRIQALANVDIYLDSEMNADDALSVEADHIVVATGAAWRTDGVGRSNCSDIFSKSTREYIFTPDDILNGKMPDGPTLVFDDDHYYHASTIAELLRLRGVPVSYVTTESNVAAWSGYTAEQSRVHRRLAELETNLVLSHNLHAFDGNSATLECVYTARKREIECESVVSVTSRSPDEKLYLELLNRFEHDDCGHTKSIKRIGDCEAPGIIAMATFAGHRYAQELDAETDAFNPMRYDRVFGD